MSNFPKGLTSLGAITGGVLASSCCILPLVLVSIGAGGAWVANLTALAPYQPIFLTLAAISIGGGIWLARRARNQSCAIDGACAQSFTKKRYVIGLWLGGILAVIAVIINALAPFLY
ncbi:MAG: mercuric transporter MerT family protein [Magnetovibrio sp.]|nr:mercuric transporter MerT family protein [Magnetovibrio sp.]